MITQTQYIDPIGAKNGTTVKKDNAIKKLGYMQIKFAKEQSRTQF